MAKRQGTVPKSDRKCLIHGVTTYSQWVGDDGRNIRWRCLKCDSDRSNKYNKEVREGIRTKASAPAVPNAIVKTCPTHHIALPATGICDDC